MAVFNPQIAPTNDPNWTNVSRPISDLAADKSSALRIGAVAEGLDAAVRTAESIDQDIIKDKVRVGVDALQRTTTAAYENVRDSMLSGAAADPRAANVAGLSLVRNAAADIPAGLDSGIDRAENIGAARAQGNLKANDTLYTGALNSLAKQLRAEYPGHIDFIDEQMRRISGKDAANAYMDNLMSDIGRLATGSNAYEKAVVSKAMQNYGDINVVNALRAYQARLPGSFDNLQKATFGAEKAKLDHQQTMQSFQEDEAAGKVDTDKAKWQAQQSAANTVYRNFNGIVSTVGLTPNVIQQIINDSREGKTSIMNPNQWESLAQALEASRDQTVNTIKNDFNKYGISRRLKDPTNEQAIIDNEVKFYDRAIAAVRDPNKGMFFELMRRSKGLQDETNYQALTTPGLGDSLMKMDLIKEKAGPNWINMVDMATVTKGYLGRMQTWYGDQTRKIGAPEDPRIGNVGKSLTSDIQNAKKAATQGVTFDPRLYDDLVKNVDYIEKSVKDGNLPTAKEVVNYMFDPARNKDFVKQFSRDFKDSNNVQHKGYFAYYDMMSAPRVVDSVRSLGDYDSWQKMKTWNETQFRQLFGTEVQALNTIQQDKGNPATIEWNSDTNQMTLKFANKPTTNADANYQRWAQESVFNLNKGMRSLGYMYSKENTDPNEGIFTMLMGLSYKPAEGLSGLNLPKMVLESINRSQFQPSEEERLRSSFDRLQKKAQ